MTVCNAGSLLGVSWSAILRWLRPGCYTCTNCLFRTTYTVITFSRSNCFSLSPPDPYASRRTLLSSYPATISNLVAVRFVPQDPDTAQSTTSRSDNTHRCHSCRSRCLFHLRMLCSFKCRRRFTVARIVRGSSETEFIHLREEGQLQYILVARRNWIKVDDIEPEKQIETCAREWTKQSATSSTIGVT